MRVVIDTNVVVAAFATEGLCHAVFELCLDRHEIILGPEILQETEKALRKKIKVPVQVAKGVIEYLREHATVLKVTTPQEKVSRDANDDHVLAVAVQAGAEFVITGDGDLLILKKHRRIKIVNPREFWEKMKNIERQDI